MNLSIRTKIVAIILFVVLLESIIALAAVGFMRDMQGVLRRTVEESGEKTRLAWLVKISMPEIHRAQKNLILSLTREDQ